MTAKTGRFSRLLGWIPRIAQSRIDRRKQAALVRAEPTLLERRQAADILRELADHPHACERLAASLELQTDPGESPGDYLAEMAKESAALVLADYYAASAKADLRTANELRKTNDQ